MKKAFLITFSTLFFINGFGQIGTQTFSISDLNPYLIRYVEPFVKAMSLSMSSGWAHSAKVHNTFGFDLSFGATYVPVPTSELVFNPQDLSMPGYSFIGNKAPTISSDKNINTTLITKQFIKGVPFGFSIPVLKGLNISYGGMLNLQASVGLPKGTDIIVRYIPDISSSSNKLIEDDIQVRRTGFLGGGLKHDIKQWIPGVKDLPFLEMSVLLGYSGFYTGFSGSDMRIDPNTLGISSDYPETTWDHQRFDIDMSSFMGSLLIGADFLFFQPFIGLGFNNSIFEGKLIGNYPIVSFSLANPLGVVNDYEANPITIKEKTNKFYFLGGTQIKIAFFGLFYSFSWQQYSLHSGGLTFTFR